MTPEQKRISKNSTIINYNLEKKASNFWNKLINKPKPINTPKSSHMISTVGNPENPIAHSIFKPYHENYQISNSKVLENFQNKGIGKKLYGNIFKYVANNKPDAEVLTSDVTRLISPKAQNLWDHFMNKTKFPITKDVTVSGPLYTLDLKKLRSMKFASEKSNKVDISTARLTALEYLKKIKPHVHKSSIVGSIYRKHPQVKDIDIVIQPKKSFKEKNKKMINTEFKGIPINIWLAPEKSYESTRMHFREGKNIIKLKENAKKRGLKLNRHGLHYKNKLLTGKENDIKQILLTPDYKKFIQQKQYPRITKNYYRFRQVDPKQFSEFKLKKLKTGTALVMGKNKEGDWKIQSVMVKKDNLEKKAFDPLSIFALGGALHVGANAGLSKLYKSKVGGKILGSLTTHGYQHGLKGVKMSPTLDRGFRYGIGPESLADYEIGRKAGKFSRIMQNKTPEQRTNFAQKYLYKVTGGKSQDYNDVIQNFSKIDYKKNNFQKFKEPILNQLKKVPGTKGVSNALEGNIHTGFSKWLSNRKTVPEKAKPSILTNITHGAIGAGLAASPIGGTEFSAQLGTNLIRDKISKTKFGKDFLTNVFKKSYEKGSVSKPKIWANKLLLSPRAGEISEAGAYLGSKEKEIKNILAPTMEVFGKKELAEKIKNFKLFKKIPTNREIILGNFKKTNAYQKGSNLIQNIMNKVKIRKV